MNSAMLSNPPLEEEVVELRRQLAESRAAFEALASGQVDAITQPAGPVLLRKAQDALRHSEENFRALIEQLPDQVWVHRDGLVIYVNPIVLECLGYRPEQLVGRKFLDLVLPEDRNAVQERIRSGTAVGQKRERYEVKISRSDGTPVVLEISAQGVLFDGAPATLEVAHDLTKRKELETRRKELEAHLLVSDRMASVGMLAAGVAHEINNPLAYVIANLRFLSDEFLAAPVVAPWSDALAEAMDGAERVRGIVRDLKAFSRSEDGQGGAVDLHSMLTAAANMASNEIRHRAHLVKAFARAPLSVEGNGSRLGQVFLNLLVNAAQAIPEGAADRNEIRLLTRVEPDGRVLVEVHDTGPGMSPEVLKRLFTPFFTTKPRGVGTGLGLSICHKIISAHGGEIKVDSEPGLGTTFRVWLPASAVEAAAPVAPRAMPSGGKRGRVLVIDDEPLVGKAVGRVLAHHHDVVVVAGGKAALALLAADPAFDVILCDLMMPEVSGPQFYERLTATWPGLAHRVVFLSGGAFTESTRAFLDSTPNLRLEKPFEVGQVLSVIAQFLLR